MITTIKTTEKTFNKNVKKQVAQLMPTAKSFKKMYVSGVGYVFYIKDASNTVLGKVFKEFGAGMVININ